jgi:beta-mannosidase
VRFTRLQNIWLQRPNATRTRDMRCSFRAGSFLSLLSMILLVLLAVPCHGETTSAPGVAVNGWQFRLATSTPDAAAHAEAQQWHAAVVPSTVQTDLLRNGLIADPFTGAHEAQLQWIGLADWEYRTTLNMDAATLTHEHVDLVFDGLDTYATVRLNGQQILEADNMFRRWRVPVKELLHSGANELTVTFASPIRRRLPGTLKRAYQLPGEFDSAFGDEPKGVQTANYIRKAAYQYGWDWGPRYVTEGIWQPVRLETWDAARLDALHVIQSSITADAASLDTQVRVEASAAAKAIISVTYTTPKGEHISLPEITAQLVPGSNPVHVPIVIEHPERWWPMGYGPQNLYQVSAKLWIGHETLTAERTTGLRTVRLLREKDQWGKSFGFEVNGVPIFAKGADVIPFDSFPDRVTPEKHREILASARDANMNMVRLWGGGYYESDDFYDECDRLGLMVWQDFMFGGAIPPDDPAFRANTEQEAIEQVDRLRDHPSLTLWCGNNEVETGWDAWPDRMLLKENISPAERAKIEAGMMLLFDDILKRTVAVHDPEVPYWPSTPSADHETEANSNDNGDVHSWSVWSGSAPIEDYLKDTPRFVSEYGFEALPDMRTIRAFATPAEQTPDSPVMRAHQKFANGNGNDRLLLYLRRYYGEPKDFPAFVYLSQAMQAQAIELEAEHLRASRPRSMGSLYWQLNDCWPAASWASIDSFGRWKALQFHARRFYNDLLIAPIRQDGTTNVYAINDGTTPVPANVHMQVMNLDGRVLSESTTPTTMPPLSSTRVNSLTDDALLKGADPAKTLVVFTMEVDGQAVSRHLLYFRAARDLSLPQAKVTAHVTAGAHGLELTLHADTLARDVWISFGDHDVSLADNAFTLLPGETRTIQLKSSADAAALASALHIETLDTATLPSMAGAGD